MPSITSVWPALWPPWNRTTTSAPTDSQSTILPFPSSPHWAPTTTTLANVDCSSDGLKRAKPRRGGKKPSRGSSRPSPKRSASLSKGAARARGLAPKSALARAKNAGPRLGLAACVAISRARPSGRRESDMTPEERQMLGGLFQRVNSAAATQRDPEAESFINDAVRAAPHAPYVLAQTVLVQQQALEAAANRISQLEAAAQRALSRTRNMAVSSAISASPFSAAARPLLRPGLILIRRPISARRPRRPRAATRRLRPKAAILRRPRRAIRRSLAPGASPSLRAAEASCKTRPRPRRAWPAASSLAISWAACSAAMAAAASLAAGRAPPGSAARALPAIRPEMTEINNYYGDRPDARRRRQLPAVRSRRAGRPGRQLRQSRQFDLRRLGWFVSTTAAATTTSDGRALSQ